MPDGLVASLTNANGFATSFTSEGYYKDGLNPFAKPITVANCN